FRSLCDFYAVPECYVVGEVFADFWDGRFQGLGVIPGTSGIDLAVHVHVIVAGLALPGAVGVLAAWFEILFLQAVWRKVPVAVYISQVFLIGLGDCLVVPDGFHDVPVYMLNKNYI